MRQLGLGLLFLISGCSTFEKDWEAAGNAGGSEAGQLAGRWQGEWLSDVNKHRGGLRCLVTQEGSERYRARYHATYGSLFTFTFEYEVEMTAERDGGTWRFRGGADLGWLAGGAYEYSGEVRGDEFRSTYTSKRDHGTFQMRRS